MIPNISIVTPTANRTQLWPLCEKFVKRAIDAYPAPVEWIVADDGREHVNCTMNQLHIKNTPLEGEANPLRSFIRNYTEGIKAASNDIILFWEDDDWHSADCISNMVKLLIDNNAILAGEANSIYYHVKNRVYHVHGNNQHASMFQTIIRGPIKERILEFMTATDDAYVDIHLWRDMVREDEKKILHTPKHPWAIGLKGLTPGNHIGAGHRPGWYRQTDPDGAVLQNWIGIDDYNYIMNYA